ncbi:MAG: c-type cytochrome [Planctomycetia bacterium]|nr:c-type cytochrome [Planctomycetia bacterium]
MRWPANFWGVFFILAVVTIAAQADDPKPPSTPLPKGPLSPEESLKHLVLADPNLVIEIVAAEPEVVDPVAIQFDEHGRLWVVEMRDYPNGPEPSQPPMSRIKLLEDKDGDGRYETAHVFADKLLFATGVQPWDGGVIVTLAGEVAYFKDTDGDHKADVRETWFTGFSESNPQLRANHPTFGPDGWIYVANGLRGGNVIGVKKDWPLVADASRVQAKDAGKGTRDASTTEPQPVSLTGRDFKFDPLTGRYEAISGNGQFGMTFDAWGNRFVCDNRHPCRHVIFEEDFIKRCPHVAFPAVVHDVIPADDKNQVFPLTSAWTTSNVHAGTFTASCGVTVYTGDWLPEEFRGNVFVCEPTGNLVQRAILEPDGVTFKSRNPYQQVSGKALAAGRTGTDKPTRDTTLPRDSTPPAASAVPLTNGTQEFLASRDDWFRPVDLQNGPDGALYVVDMYRAVIEHPEWVPDELKKRPDTWLGNDKGRIYRIRSRSAPPAPSKLPELRTNQFAFLNDGTEGHRSECGWYVTTASRQMHERLTKPEGLERLRAEFGRLEGEKEKRRGFGDFQSSPSAVICWNSAALSDLISPFAPIGIYEGDELNGLIIRRFTAMSVDENLNRRTRDLAAMGAMNLIYRCLANEVESETLRFEMIKSLSVLSPPRELSDGFNSTLKGYASEAPWMRLAVLAAELPRAAEFLHELIDSGADHYSRCATAIGGCQGEESIQVWGGVAETFSALGEQIGQKAPDWAVRHSIERLFESYTDGRFSAGSSRFPIVASGLIGIKKGITKRVGVDAESIRRIWSEQVSNTHTTLEGAINDYETIDQKAPEISLPRRQIGIRFLAAVGNQRAEEYLGQLVETETDQSLRIRVIEAFASLNRPNTDKWLIDRYRSETPAIRRAILAALFASKERQLRLLEAIEQGQIAATELGPVQVDQLTQSKDETIRERAKKILAGAAPASRKEVLDAYQSALSLKGDPQRGKAVFVKNCSTCHRVDNVGVNVAPDISDTRTKKPEQLLMDILDPNKAIDANYFAYAVVTKEGKTESGVISSESSNSITLKQPEGKVLTLLRSDIEEIRNTGLSLMPVGVEKNIDQQALADLIFWLKNWRYLDGKVPATSIEPK